MPLPYTGGVTLSFTPAAGGASASFSEITRITYGKQGSGNRPRISIAHLGSPMTVQNGTAITRLEEPYANIWQATGAGSGNALDVEYIGGGAAAAGVSGTLNLSGPFSFNVTNATITSCVVTGAVGDIVRRSIQVVW